MTLPLPFWALSVTIVGTTPRSADGWDPLLGAGLEVEP